MGILGKLRLLGPVLLTALALGIAADAQTPRKGGILRVANLAPVAEHQFCHRGFVMSEL